MCRSSLRSQQNVVMSSGRVLKKGGEGIFCLLCDSLVHPHLCGSDLWIEGQSGLRSLSRATEMIKGMGQLRYEEVLGRLGFFPGEGGAERANFTKS